MAENNLCRNGDKCNKGPKCRFVHPKLSETCTNDNNSKDHSSTTVNQIRTKFEQPKPTQQQNMKLIPSGDLYASSNTTEDFRMKKPCKDGDTCKFFPKCRYDHSSSTLNPLTTGLEKLELPKPNENVLSTSSLNSFASNTEEQSLSTKKPCKDGDSCKYFPKCRYDHSSSTLNPLTIRSRKLEPKVNENDSRDSSTSSTSTEDPKIKKKCRYGVNCRKQPECEFDHTPYDERTSSSLVSEMMKQISHELNNNVPIVHNEHELRIKSIRSKSNDDDDEEITQNLLREHQSQLETFNSTIESYASAATPSNNYTAKHRLGAIRREIKRLKLHLPIYARRDKLLDVIRSNRVLILKADTGSGKSTQLVQYLVDGGFAENGQIVCTQPRRLAARTLASRVAEEFGCKVTEEVGFRIGAIRPRVSDATKICFVTDSVLLNEYIDDPKLSKYSIVIIDEAHERRVDTDLLFGIMKLCLKQRSDLKLIVMSATLDANLLGNYYQNSALLEIPGRTYPIEDEYADDDVEKYVEASIAKTLEIHNSKEPGDILIFLTGPDEIDRAVEDVQGKLKESAIVLPLHGKLTEDDTKRVFEPTPKNKRKIIFSTNVAETSVTIDGVRHVIETGMVKESMWDVKRQMQVLKIGTITQSSVKQRRGRAGRTSPGKCYHLYTKEMYESLDACPRAEILCIQPSIAVLKLKHLGVVDDIEKFDWLEAPSLESIRNAIQSLKYLGALDPHTNKLTETGRFMAQLGLSPMLSAMILKSAELSCEGHVIALAGMLSIAQNIWWRSKDPELRQLAAQKRAYFAHDNDQGGDHIQLLKIYLEWESKERGEQRSTWCRENMINGKALNIASEFVLEVYRQLKKKAPDLKSIIFDQNLVDRILRCVTGGYFQNLALSNGSLKAGYKLITTENTNAQVYNTSTITFGKQPAKYVVYHEILNLNGTNCMTVICPIQYEWLPQAWLSSLSRQPADLGFVNHTFENLGPLLMRACLGKRCVKKQQLEDLLGVVLDVNYEQSTLTIWCEKNKLNNGKLYLEKLMKFEREKLIKEVEEYDIVGSTRILLREGGEPILVLTADEYVNVIVKGLPSNVTEEEIEKKFQTCGKVRCVNIIQSSNNGTSASVIYDRMSDAQNAVVRLTNEIWNGRNLIVSPNYNRTSGHTNSQNCKLEVRWFLTESECQGKIIFTQKESAEIALKLIQDKLNCQCRLQMNFINPTIRCQWLIEQHNGQAFIDFQTNEQAEKYVQEKRNDRMKIQLNKKNPASIFIRNIPNEYDEEDLREKFPEFKSVKLQFNTKISQIENFDDIKENIRRLFRNYQSFLIDKITIQPQTFIGRVEVLAEFTDENEAKTIIQEMNGRTGYINTGKIRLSLMSAIQNKKITQTNDEYIVKFFKLSPDIIEEDILNELKKNHLADNVSYISIFRKKLNQTLNIHENNSNKLQLQSEINKLQNLFNSNKYFRSQPEIDIRPATDDGRVVALVIYNNPDDVTTAMNLYKDPQQKHLLQFNQYKLHLIPHNDHVIELNRSLVKAIPEKIEKALEQVRSMNLLNVKIFKKEFSKNEKKITRIHIQGSDNLEIARARAVFDRLMKGLEFRFNDSSWIQIMFSPDGKKSLQTIQESTNTYIWWNWSSTFLRIYGNDDASNLAYRKIDEFIQDRLENRKDTIKITIPQGCLRQCLRNINKIKDLSDENTFIEIDIIKKVINIKGEQKAVKMCETRINQYLITLQETKTTINTSNNFECPLCCSTCESPYTLQQCGHTYCRGCLMNYFETHIDSTMNLKQFKLSCLVEKCNLSCLIRDIKSILGTEKMTRLAKAAFQIYLKQSGVDLAQCIGIDCIQIYRPSKNSVQYTCDQCVKNYCISCQTECHEGLSCEEHKKLMAKQRDEQLLKENLGLLPLKKCPNLNCNILIEKYAGCNAVKCTQCSIAFCWLCSTTDPNDAHPHFSDKSKPCYGKTYT